MNKCGLGIAVLASAVLMACETTQKTGYEKGEDVIRQYAGEGACLDCFGVYTIRNEHKAFALSESGNFGFSYGDSSPDVASEYALQSCQSQNDMEAEKPCRLLMVNDDYVW